MRQIEWFVAAGVDRFDVAVSLSPTNEGGMIRHLDIGLDGVYRLAPFMRARNAHGANIYVRPARRRNDTDEPYSWPVIYVDDISRPVADRIARAYASCIVATSDRNYQAWVRCTRPLEEAERARCQRHVAGRCGGDPGSISGEHFGRLVGYRNHKPDRHRYMVRVYRIADGPSWDPSRVLTGTPMPAPSSHPPRGGAVVQHGFDESRDEWGWVSGRLAWLRRIDAAPDRVANEVRNMQAEIERRARDRRKPNPARYAERTVRKARAYAIGSVIGTSR